MLKQFSSFFSKSVHNLRDTGSSGIYVKAKELAEALELNAQLSSKRKRKVKRLSSELAEDESCKLTDEQMLDRECNEVYDKILSDLKWRFQKLEETASDFHFLSVDSLFSTAVETLKKHAADLALKYSVDLDAAELVSEIESFNSTFCN